MGNDYRSIPAGIVDDDIENRWFPVGWIVEILSPTFVPATMAYWIGPLL